MTTKPKFFYVFYLLAGLLVGIFVGASIGRQWVTVVSRLISSCVILATALFWRRVESYAHKRYLETWSIRRIRGKWAFIVTHYIFLRGGLLFAAFVGPMFLQSPITKETLMIISVSLLVLTGSMVYLGHASWTECERDYEIKMLRGAAERMRTVSN